MKEDLSAVAAIVGLVCAARQSSENNCDLLELTAWGMAGFLLLLLAGRNAESLRSGQRVCHSVFMHLFRWYLDAPFALLRGVWRPWQRRGVAACVLVLGLILALETAPAFFVTFATLMSPVSAKGSFASSLMTPIVFFALYLFAMRTIAAAVRTLRYGQTAANPTVNLGSS